MGHNSLFAGPPGTIPRQPNPEPDVPAPPHENDPADDGPADADEDEKHRPGRPTPPLRT